jgi:hypothetical protein
VAIHRRLLDADGPFSFMVPSREKFHAGACGTSAFQRATQLCKCLHVVTREALENLHSSLTGDYVMTTLSKSLQTSDLTSGVFPQFNAVRKESQNIQDVNMFTKFIKSADDAARAAL